MEWLMTSQTNDKVYFQVSVPVCELCFGHEAKLHKFCWLGLISGTADRTPISADLALLGLKRRCFMARYSTMTLSRTINVLFSTEIAKHNVRVTLAHTVNNYLRQCIRCIAAFSDTFPRHYRSTPQFLLHIDSFYF
jgi:hypothetical protein